MTGCKIGKVTPKKVYEIKPHIRGSEHRQTMHEHVDIICDLHTKGIAAFAIVAIGFDGAFSRGTRIHDDSPIGLTLLPAAVAEILRRDTAADIAKDVISGDL